MSNIKLIDGLAIDIDKVEKIYYGGCQIWFEQEGSFINKHIPTPKSYTEEEAQARIKQILEKQNSEEIEI